MPPKIDRQVFYTVFIGDKTHNVTGRKRTKQGYVVLCVKTHPNSDMNGYVMEHRIIMETYLGRYLESDEVVHHENEVKHDNRFFNLTLMNIGKHVSMHHAGKKRSLETKTKQSLWAKKRLLNKINHPSYKNVDEELKKLYRNGWKPTAISKALGITRRTVYNKIEYLRLKEEKHD